MVRGVRSKGRGVLQYVGTGIRIWSAYLLSTLLYLQSNSISVPVLSGLDIVKSIIYEIVHGLKSNYAILKCYTSC